jgi:hypothetical protein
MEILKNIRFLASFLSKKNWKYLWQRNCCNLKSRILSNFYRINFSKKTTFDFYTIKNNNE